MALILVPTPLGNLRDVTLRALEVLRDCDLIVAEDTRVARKLLSALDLPGKPIRSYHAHSSKATASGIVERARHLKVAVLADAGMPGISDPGNELVAAARASGVPVEALPGPSAALAAAVLSGFPLRRFLFEGFLPRSSGARRAELSRSLSLGIPCIYYESPQRIRQTLRDVAAVDSAARVFLLREYTKRYEQQILGTAPEVADQLSDPVRGEIALTILPSARKRIEERSEPVEDRIDALLEQDKSVAAIAKALAGSGYGDRRTLYALAGERKRRKRVQR